MAALLTTNQVQVQIQQSNHHYQPYDHHIQVYANTPSSSSSYQSPPSGPDHFCKDCGVMFESATSLEVHLSYHKENLLSRWATQQSTGQDSSNEKISSASSNSSVGSSGLTSPSPVKASSSVGESPPGYFVPHHHPHPHQMMMESQYHPHPHPHPHQHLFYNNNTGDQQLQGSPRMQQQGPPVDLPNGSGGGIAVYENNPHLTIPHPNPHGHLLGHPPPPPPPARDSEILDLDSHKVHIYQHQQQQQQQGFFHRPYLPHLFPPGPHPNGAPWGGPPGGGEQHFRFSPAPGPVSLPPPPGYIETQTNSSSGLDNPSVGPPHFSPHPPQQQRSGNSTQPESPYLQHAKCENPSPPGGGTPAAKEVVVVSSATPSSGSNKSGGGGVTPSASSAGKTKGWKGGECKRPKTYQCPACNKWFTSSGHLKRHYGTTLHKNSMKNLGDNAEELFKAQMKGKKGGRGTQSAALIVNTTTETPPPPAPKPKTPKGPKGGSKTPKQQRISTEESDVIIEEERKPESPPPQVTYPQIQNPHEIQIHHLHINGNNHHHHHHDHNKPPPPQLSFANVFPHPPSSNFSPYPPPPPPSYHHQLPPYPNHHHHQIMDPYGPPPPPTTLYNGFVPSDPGGNPLPPFHSLYHNPPPPDMDYNNRRVTPPTYDATPSPHLSQGDFGGPPLTSSPPPAYGSSIEDEDDDEDDGASPDVSSSSDTTKEHFNKALNVNSPSGGGRRPPKNNKAKAHTCDLCPKGFAHKTDLARHRLLHTKERPFTCSTCSKGFIRKDHLTKHVLSCHVLKKEAPPIL